jgi:hypothetical protein
MSSDTRVTHQPSIDTTDTPLYSSGRDTRDRAIHAIQKDAEKETPPVRHALSLIDSHLAGMSFDLERMEHDLSIALGPDYTMDSPAAEARPSSSELTGVLMDMVDRLGNYRSRFDAILNRVEL